MRYLFLLCVVLVGCVQQPALVVHDDPSTLTIANWNLQVFGPTKGSNPELVRMYAEKMSNYDIIFVQEIRDQSGEAFDNLCNAMPKDYNCKLSSRAGRSVSKEQYGVIYKKDVWIDEWNDLSANEDMYEFWERPPLVVTFEWNNTKLVVWDIHIKPDDAETELANLYSNVQGNESTIVIGDFNMDCSFYAPEEQPLFDDWTAVVGDAEDTTTVKTDCAYDRIFLNTQASQFFVRGGVDRKDITPTMSDHYLVWAELKR